MINLFMKREFKSGNLYSDGVYQMGYINTQKKEERCSHYFVGIQPKTSYLPLIKIRLDDNHIDKPFFNSSGTILTCYSNQNQASEEYNNLIDIANKAQVWTKPQLVSEARLQKLNPGEVILIFDKSKNKGFSAMLFDRYNDKGLFYTKNFNSENKIESVNIDMSPKNLVFNAITYGYLSFKSDETPMESLENKNILELLVEKNFK